MVLDLQLKWLMTSLFNRFSLTFVLFLAVVAGVGCENNSGNKVAAKPGDTVVKTSEDRLISTLSERPPVDISKCEEALVQSICVTRLSKNDIDPECRINEVTEKQKQVILEIYRELPPLLQKPLCQIHRIQLHPRMEQIAYSAMIMPGDPAKKPVYIIGIQADALATTENKIDFISGKEMKAFFKNQSDFENPKTAKPYAFIQSKVINYQSLYIFAHELAHVLDYQQNITALAGDDCQPQAQVDDLQICQYSKGRYGHLSWGEESYLIKAKKNKKITLVESEAAVLAGEKPFWSRKFPSLADICFYNCSTSKNNAMMILTYDELNRSNFVTLYGSTSPAEDFAESLSLLLLSKTGKFESFQVLQRSEGSGAMWPFIDVFKHMQSPIMSEKMRWLNQWLDTQ